MKHQNVIHFIRKFKYDRILYQETSPVVKVQRFIHYKNLLLERKSYHRFFFSFISAPRDFGDFMMFTFEWGITSKSSSHNSCLLQCLGGGWA